jgi:hypothetical protein
LDERANGRLGRSADLAQSDCGLLSIPIALILAEQSHDIFKGPRRQWPALLRVQQSVVPLHRVARGEFRT